MKPTQILPLAIAAMAFTANAAQAQDYIGHNVTAKFTVTEEQDNPDVTKDNGDIIYSTEIVKSKFSNKEILQMCIDENLIDDTTIEGWKLVFISEDAEEYDMLAVHKDGTQVYIGENFWLSFYEDHSNWSYKGKYDDSEEFETATGTIDSESYCDLYGLDDNTDNSHETVGTFTGKYKYDDDNSYSLISGTFENLTGAADDDGSDFGIIRGSVDVGKGSIFEYEMR